MNLFIDSSGKITCVGEPAIDMYRLGNVTRHRVSHILPTNRTKRKAFRLLRWVFGDKGRVAAWTRTWRGPWYAVIRATGQRKQHASRQVLLAWEREQIEWTLQN